MGRIKDETIISIHALHAECDGNKRRFRWQKLNFNPRTPCGVRPKPEFENHLKEYISIHALHAECDLSASRFQAPSASYFNPRTPCGVRRWHLSFPRFWRSFQSTHSMRSATLQLFFVTCIIVISIHALHAECDAPCFFHDVPSWHISIHALHAECDRR